MSEPGAGATGSTHGLPTIGFIGIGAMGLPMAKCLMAHGYHVVAYDTQEAALRALGPDAEIASSSRAVADRADIVLACLPTLAAHRSAVIGADGLGAGRRMRTYIHLSTTGAGIVNEIAAALAPRVVVDAPVTGGVERAIQGTLTTIVSADRAAMAEVMPVLRSYSSHVVEVSDRTGDAQLMKLINNILSTTNLAIACEAMLVGAKAGLDAAVMLDVLNHGSGQNSATLTKIPNNVLTRQFDFGAALSIILKDAGQFIEEAKARGVPTTMASAAIENYRKAAEQEGLNADMTAVIRPMERAAHFEMPVTKIPKTPPANRT